MVDWGGNYPPGARNDPRAPYNQPDWNDVLPLWCEKCDFKAETFEELQNHKHRKEAFSAEPREYYEEGGEHGG